MTIEAQFPQAEQWLADIGYKHDAAVATRITEVIIDGMAGIAPGENAYPLKISILVKTLAGLIAAVPPGDGSQEIVDGLCETVGGAIVEEARKLRRALAKDQRAFLKASKRAFGRPLDG